MSDADLCGWFDFCKKHGYSVMEEDQAGAIGRDPGREFGLGLLPGIVSQWLHVYRIFLKQEKYI